MNHNPIYNIGETVFIIMRNPHVQNATHVQQATIMEFPDDRNELALFLHEAYYPLTDQLAVFKSEAEAEKACSDAFGYTREEGFDA